MATDTAPDVTFTMVDGPPVELTPARPPRRHYWQLPLFVVGVVAAVAAWRAFPPQPDNPADLFHRDLAALKQAVDRKPPDAAQLAEAARKVAGDFEQYPADANQANFLLGSAHGFLAEAGTDGAENWRKAAAHFSKCDALALADKADQGRCVFRSAKATAAVGAGNPVALLPALQALPTGEDPRRAFSPHRRDLPAAQPARPEAGEGGTLRVPQRPAARRAGPGRPSAPQALGTLPPDERTGEGPRLAPADRPERPRRRAGAGEGAARPPRGRGQQLEGRR